MKVQCPKCNTTYRIPDDRVPAGGGTVKVRCKNCGDVIDVQAAGSGGTPVPEARWFVAMGNDKQGPMAREQVLALVRSGEIGRETFVWRKGFKEWQRLGDVPELAIAEFGPRAVEAEATPALTAPRAGERETGSDMEPTVMEPLPAGAGVAEVGPAAASGEAGPGAFAAASPGAPSAATGGPATQDEDSQTQMIWQRRETSVLFSLDDYKTRKKTRSGKAVTAPSPVVQVQPVGPAKAEAPAPRRTERVTVISLEEAEVKRVAEALSRRQRRRVLVRNVLLGLTGGVIVAVAAYVVTTRLGGKEPVPAQEHAAKPPPVVSVPAAEPPPAKEPVPVPAPPPAAKEEAPTQEPPVQAAKEAPRKNGRAAGARTAQRPARVEARTPVPPREPEEKTRPPARPATDDVNALLANLRSGQGEGAAASGDRAGKTGAESGEALPEQLTTGQIQSVLRRQQKAVEECIRKSGVAPGTTVTVNTRVEIEGSGRVSSASVSSAGAAEGCIRSVLTGLRFPRFRGSNMVVPYPFRVNL